MLLEDTPVVSNLCMRTLFHSMHVFTMSTLHAQLTVNMHTYIHRIDYMYTYVHSMYTRIVIVSGYDHACTVRRVRVRMNL